MSNSASRPARPRAALALSSLAALGLGACSGAPSAPQRLFAVHNAFEALGMSQLGHITEGSLGEGSTARIPVDVEAQCYTFVAFGGDGARSVELQVQDAQNQRLAGSTTHSGQATVHYCPSARGRVTLALRMAQGSGSYVLGSWRGGPRGGAGATAVAAAETGGTCQSPLPLTLGQAVQGDTSRARNRQTGACLGESEAGELVYSFTLERRMFVSAAVEADFPSGVYIRSDCDSADEEAACVQGESGTTTARAVLEPGTWYVFVDGAGDEEGSFSLTVTGQDVPTPQEVCQQATAITPGQAVTGTTANGPDIFRASCANRAPGPDHVYRLEVPQESRLQLSQETDYDGVLYLRRACAEASTEVACNDDAGDIQHSRINTVLPAGTYYVFTDGFSAGSAGNFTFQADLAPVAGAGTQGDTCQDALPLTPGTSVEGNTFAARDDVQTPCGTQTDGYDLVYRVELQRRSRFTAWFESTDIHQPVLYLARSCAAGAANAAVACRTEALGAEHGLDAIVDAGTYYLVVDTQQARSFGRFRLNSRVEDIAAMERLCRAAPQLRTGVAVTGTTTGDDRFHSRCAGGSASAENLYRLVLRRRSHVVLDAETTNHDGSLYVRRDCLDANTEVECNDDHGDTRHSHIETDLDPGTYTVFVDGFSNHNNGAYTLRPTITPL